MGGGICSTSDGNYIITGIAYTANLFRQGYIIKIDTAGNKIWDKLYGGKGLDAFDIPLELSNGEIILMGGLGDTIPPNNPLGWLVKISANGDSLWSRTFKIREAQHYFTDIKQTADAGFIISGYVFPDSTNNTEDMWLIKVDSLGCDTAGCWITDIKEDLAVGSGNRQLMIYPNPNDGNMHLDYVIEAGKKGNIIIYDLTGRKLINRQLDGRGTLKISDTNLNEGIYFYEIFVESESIVANKIVIIR